MCFSYRYQYLLLNSHHLPNSVQQTHIVIRLPNNLLQYRQLHNSSTLHSLSCCLRSCHQCIYVLLLYLIVTLLLKPLCKMTPNCCHTLKLLKTPNSSTYFWNPPKKLEKYHRTSKRMRKIPKIFRTPEKIPDPQKNFRTPQKNKKLNTVRIISQIFRMSNISSFP